MNLLLKFILVTLFLGCNTKHEKSKDSAIQPIKIDSLTNKEFYSRTVISDTNLTNTSGHRIIILYNSINNFFPQTDSIGFRFPTECLFCEPIQVYNEHLVFGGQLEIFNNKVIFNDKELAIPKNSLLTKRIGSNGRDSKPNNFKFSNGSGQIKYLEQSCNDAELNLMTLTYKTGQIKIRNLLNADFFYFDSNKDGVSEQYILATRNCSQELAILKIE